MILKKYIGDKKFYKMVLTVALPIMVQNGISNFVNLLDNVMVGRLGTEAMSGVTIVNQFIFIFNLLIFGALSSAGIFTAQFHGNGDVDGERYTVRFKLILALLSGIAGVVVFLSFDNSLISLFLHEGTTPRRLTDLIGSLCDLTSGSGDKGTPIVYIQGYFDNYTTD